MSGSKPGIDESNDDISFANDDFFDQQALMGQRAQHGSQRAELEMARQKFKMDLNTTSISMVNSTHQSLIDADQSLISVFKTNNNNSLDSSLR